MSHPDAIRTMNYDITTPNILEQVRFPECASSGLGHAQRLLLPRTKRSTCDDRRSMTSRPADEGGYLSRAVLFTTWMMQISRLPRALEYGLPLSRAAWMPASINEVLLHMQPASKLPASLHVDFWKDVRALHLTPNSTGEALLPRY
jgi:hypothetical protein